MAEPKKIDFTLYLMQGMMKRVQPLVDKHGITSPQVLEALRVWGRMLDEANFLDASCRFCGHSITYSTEHERYLHKHTGKWYCLRVAAGHAVPA